MIEAKQNRFFKILLFFVNSSGMRTHIRMHFDKKTNDFNEESYISCILDEDCDTEVAQSASTSTIGTGNAENSHSQQLHHCDKCNYSSTYKGNVVSK